MNTATRAAVSPPPRVVIFCDGENVDGVLSGIISSGSGCSRRRPRSAERPRWQRLVAHVRKMFPESSVDAHMFLVERHHPAFWGFVQRLPDLELRPVLLAPEPNVPVVDNAIMATLEFLGQQVSDDLIVVVSHDGVYVDQLVPLLAKGRRVVACGFVELMSSRYNESGIPLWDLERDVGAFDNPLPRAQTTATVHHLATFDPESLFERDACVNVHQWRVGDEAMLAGDPVTIRGFIDRGCSGPLDEALVEFASGERRTVRRDELTFVPKRLM